MLFNYAYVLDFTPVKHNITSFFSQYATVYSFIQSSSLVAQCAA